MPNLLDLIKKDEGIQTASREIADFGAGVLKGLTTDSLGILGDLINAGREKTGAGSLPIGTNDIRGLFGIKPIEEDTVTETLGNLASVVIQPEKLIPSLGHTPVFAGIFAGKGASSWDALEAQRVIDAEKTGKKLISDYRRMPDGEIKKEISDTGLKLVPINTKEVRENLANAYYNKPFDRLLLGEQKEVDGQAKYAINYTFSHPKLEAEYPFIERMAKLVQDHNIKMDWNAKPGGTGSLTPSYPFFMSIKAKARNEKELREVVVHELQHAVQTIEKWQNGGNLTSATKTKQFQDAMADIAKSSGVSMDELKNSNIYDILAYEAYKRLYGEAEARLVAQRIDMSEQVRKITEPKFDTPLRALIHKKDLPKNF